MFMRKVDRVKNPKAEQFQRNLQLHIDIKRERISLGNI